jgi:hypothetical protein
MRGNGPWKRRGFAIASIAFVLSAVMLESAPQVGAAPSPTGIVVTTLPPGLRQQAGPVANTKAKAFAHAKAVAHAKAAAKAKHSSLSLPQLLFYALTPFFLMGVYLFGSDYMRSRQPKKHRASLVITRVSNR